MSQIILGYSSGRWGSEHTTIQPVKCHKMLKTKGYHIDIVYMISQKQMTLQSNHNAFSQTNHAASQFSDIMTINLTHFA